MAGVYRLSNMAVFICICVVPHWSLCDNRHPSLLFPGTRKRNCKALLLAPDHWRNYCGGPWDMFNQFILKNGRLPIFFYFSSSSLPNPIEFLIGSTIDSLALSSVRISARLILPLIVIGNASTNSITRGLL